MIGLCIGLMAGITLLLAFKQWLRSHRKHHVMSSPNDDDRDAGKCKKSSPPTNYTTVEDEMVNSESFNTSTVNETFEMASVKRTESFQSLSPLINQ